MTSENLPPLGLLHPLAQFLSQSWTVIPEVMLQLFGIVEELLFHPLNPAGAVEAPGDKAKSGAGFNHTHHPLKTRIQDPQFMPSSISAECEVRYTSEGWRKSL